MEGYCLMVTEFVSTFGNRLQLWWWLHKVRMYLMLLNYTFKWLKRPVLEFPLCLSGNEPNEYP